MYEHPVFCLASQVMDLTIREYLPPQPQLFFFLLVTVSMHVNHQKQPQIFVISVVVLVCNIDCYTVLQALIYH